MTHPKRFFIFLTAFCFYLLKLTGNETAKIKLGMFQIDHDHKLIVINQNLSEINKDNVYSSVELDNTYKLATPTNKFNLGVAYKAINSLTEEEYNLYFTELPIINITTDNEIVDEPRRLAHFTITENDGSTISSNIGIEYRGSSSQAYPKKSFRIEFWEGEDDYITKDVSLLGLRSDDDWNLQAMYNEQLRIRSKTSNDLWQMINNLYYQSKEPDAINGIRMKYSVLFFNGEYRGLYCVGERVDRKQLKLKKYKDKVRGELYKGIDWRVACMYKYCPEYSNESEIWSGFEYQYPDEVAIDWSLLYNHINYIVNSSVIDFNSQYKSHIEVSNAIDYFIFLNLLRAIDNTGKNIFVAKYKENDPYFFVPWDLDAVFGAYWNGDREDITDDILTNGLYDRLRLDNNFINQLHTRWKDLRNDNIISEESLVKIFRENYNYLTQNGVYERERIAWEYKQAEDEFAYLKNWISKRIAYLDSEFKYDKRDIEEKENDIDYNIKIYPNPASEYLILDSQNNDISHIDIYKICGTFLRSVKVKSLEQTKISLSNFMPGIYFITINGINNIYQTEKIIIKK